MLFVEVVTAVTTLRNASHVVRTIVVEFDLPSVLYDWRFLREAAGTIGFEL